jgi:hypothetical protein
VALITASLVGVTMMGGAQAGANPPSPDAADAAQPAGPISVPSAPPASTTSADGWTLVLSANSETLTPAVPLAPDVPPREFIATGLFNGTLRNPGQGKAPTPAGVIEVGYQVKCNPAGMMDAALKPSSTNIEVLKQEFTTADPTATVTNFRIPVDCGAGQAFIRSYAILTRATGTTDAVVAYYGTLNPV